MIWGLSSRSEKKDKAFQEWWRASPLEHYPEEYAKAFYKSGFREFNDLEKELIPGLITSEAARFTRSVNGVQVYLIKSLQRSSDRMERMTLILVGVALLQVILIFRPLIYSLIRKIW